MTLPSLADELGAARSFLQRTDDATVATQVAIAQVAAPTGQEAGRARFVGDRLRAAGMADVRSDAAGNVLATRPGATAGAPVVLISHLDTVFPAETPLAVSRAGDRLLGPGIVDNARGLAGMLAIADTLHACGIVTQRPVLFVGSVGEEGAGDLRGAKALFAAFDESPVACIALDGAGDDRIVTTGLGAARYRVTFSGEGAHSWSGFGTPNPVHAAGLAISRIAAISLPSSPKGTLSVCRMGGGVSINAIPGEAWIEIDARSARRSVLDRLGRELHTAIRDAVADANASALRGSRPLTATIAIIGDRPCGETDDRHPLVRAAAEITAHVGRVAHLDTSSTDANVAMSLGIAAISIGAGGRAGGTHTTHEWYENVDGASGVLRALAIVVAATRLPR